MDTEQITHIESHQDNNNFANHTEQSEDIEVNSIDVPIMVVFGNVKLSLKQLHQLKIGDQLQLDKWNQLVKLYVYEQQIAEGILVDIGGVLGVKITQKTNFN
jgi:flagellar motor switch/type III secretory pathway protein FliN